MPVVVSCAEGDERTGAFKCICHSEKLLQFYTPVCFGTTYGSGPSHNGLKKTPALWRLVTESVLKGVDVQRLRVKLLLTFAKKGASDIDLTPH